MDIASLIARAILLKEQLNTKPCARCGLLYDHRQNSCPHCSHLNEHELSQLLETKALELEGAANLGRKLLLGALALAGLMIIFVAVT